MLVANLNQFLTAPDTKPTSPRLKFWLSLSLTFSAIYAAVALKQAFDGEYVVQDDARQHVFWMLRFFDPNLFPNDLIADYFQSVAPAGYTAVYKLFATVGVNPLLLNKLLPMVLGLIATAYCFGVVMQLLPVPGAGFLATLLLNQAIWIKDDLVSGTPRAFVYPLFLAFLYYLLRRNLLGVAVAIALLGLFYPHYMLISAVLLFLRLFDWENKRLRLSQNRSDLILGAVGLGVAFIVLLPFALTSSKFGPAITATEARQLLEFAPKGRAQFFHTNPFVFWFNGQRSGFLPRKLFEPVTLWPGLLLPILLRFLPKFTLGKQVKGEIILLPQLLLASLVMFLAAHALLFKLHIPSRYTGLSLRIIMSLASAIALTILLDSVFSWIQRHPGFSTTAADNPQSKIALGVVALVGAAIVLYPSFVPNFPLTKYKVGEFPALYEFFQKQPQDILIASLADEASNLPTFSQRSILSSEEYAIPYQVGYYREFRQRTIELIRAHYSPDPTVLKDFTQKYGIDFWLLESDAFTPEYLADDDWITLYQPVASEALQTLKQGAIPALVKVRDRCRIFETKGLVVLQAECTAKAL